MKKTVFILFAAMLAGSGASAQVIYHRQPATAPWTGDNLYSVHVGSFYQPYILHLDAVDSRQGLPLSISLRYDGEMAMGTKWVSGFQAELNYTTIHSSYTLNGDKQVSYTKESTIGKWLNYDIREWNLTLEERLMVGYYVSENLSLFIAPGFYEDFLASRSYTLTIADKTTGVETQGESMDGKASFRMHTGFSGAVGAYYYFNDNLFVTAAAKVHIPIRFFSEDKDLPTTYGLMVGVGYKFIR